MPTNIIDIDMGMPVVARTKDIKAKTMSSAIAQRLEMLILTRFLEFPMEPLIGSDIGQSLFQPSSISADIAESVVRQVIEDWEPRVEVLDVVAVKPSEHSLEISVSYRIINDDNDGIYDITLSVQ